MSNIVIGKINCAMIRSKVVIFPISIVAYIIFIISCEKRDFKAVAKVETKTVSEIMATTAKATGDIIDLGNGITDYGHCWGLAADPTISNSKTSLGAANKIGTYSSELKTLEPGSAYHIRSYVKCGDEVIYGIDKQFATIGRQISDADGNVYNTVIIGTQIWITENLKTTKYNDSTRIPNIIDNTAWAALSTPAYCWYDNNVSNQTIYGALYSWYVVDAASNGGKNVCPSGWHVPSDDEWTTLTTFLGDNAGGKMKETGTIHWSSPNTGATNSSLFTALPSGYRYSDGKFYSMGNSCEMWSRTPYDANSAYRYTLGYDYSYVDRSRIYGLKRYGFSVRCIKD
jgi:uncharacterized protein (TIGR02145 family)